MCMLTGEPCSMAKVAHLAFWIWAGPIIGATILRRTNSLGSKQGVNSKRASYSSGTSKTERHRSNCVVKKWRPSFRLERAKNSSYWIRIPKHCPNKTRMSLIVSTIEKEGRGMHDESGADWLIWELWNFVLWICCAWKKVLKVKIIQLLINNLLPFCYLRSKTSLILIVLKRVITNKLLIAT